MPGCAVYGCRNYNRTTKGSTIKYYRFPKDEALKKVWIAACKRQDVINIKNACICSTHFEPSSFETSFKQQLAQFSSKNWRDLKLDAVPTLHLPEMYKRQSESIEDHTEGEKRQKIDIAIPSTSTCNMEYEVPTKSNTRQTTNVQTMSEILRTSSHGISENVENIQLDFDKDTNLEIENENSLLKERIKELENQNRTLLKEVQEKDRKYEQISTNLGLFFTNGQIKRLMDPKCKKAHWSPEDIASAISLRSVSPKAYRYLKSTGYPLPALSTLGRWTSTFSVDTGVM